MVATPTTFALFGLLAYVAAVPQSASLDHSNLIKERVGAKIIEQLARNQDKVANPVARQLLGGGDEYAPYEVPCPSDLEWIRPAQGLSSGESDYLERRQQYLTAINTMMTNAGLSTPPRTPNIGLALSGGGYRAMTVGSGATMGLMNSSDEARASGIGGWFDGVSYMAGLSGGSWATASLMANGGRDALDLVNNVWDLESNLIFPDDGKLSFYYDLVSNVRAKANEGFPTQITDYWSLAIGNHMLPSQYRLDNSPNLTFSQLPQVVGALGNASLPFPIIIAAEREPGELVIPENATTWEFTPYEFGAWAFGANTKVRGAFTPLEYFGTVLNNGSPNGTCYKGFDQLSFIMGTSSTLFSGALLQLNTTQSDGLVTSAIQSLLDSISDQENDVAQVPNTFANWNTSSNPISDFQYITLVDAGLTNQNIPLEPLLIPSRNVDAIIAVDLSADTTYSWPNGSAMRTTYERSIQLARQENVGIRMPVVPSVNGFINGGLNTRPVFFGCNETDTPLIVYVPNYPWSYASNVSTYQLAYELPEAQGVVLSGMRAMTLNGSVETWPRCLACAMSDRAFGYTAENRSSECAQCFDTWCWNGQDDSAEPSGEYEPVVGTVPSFLTERNLTSSTGTSASNAITPSAVQSQATSQATSQGAGVRQGGQGAYGVFGVVAGVGALLGGLLVL